MVYVTGTVVLTQSAVILPSTLISQLCHVPGSGQKDVDRK